MNLFVCQSTNKCVCNGKYLKKHHSGLSKVTHQGNHQPFTAVPMNRYVLQSTNKCVCNACQTVLGLGKDAHQGNHQPFAKSAAGPMIQYVCQSAYDCACNVFQLCEEAPFRSG